MYALVNVHFSTIESHSWFSSASVKNLIHLLFPFNLHTKRSVRFSTYQEHVSQCAPDMVSLPKQGIYDTLKQSSANKTWPKALPIMYNLTNKKVSTILGLKIMVGNFYPARFITSQNKIFFFFVLRNQGNVNFARHCHCARLPHCSVSFSSVLFCKHINIDNSVNKFPNVKAG